MSGNGKLRLAVEQMLRWKQKYEAQKAIAESNALWLEAHRRLVKEQANELGVSSLDRIIAILDEIESECDDGW